MKTLKRRRKENRTDYSKRIKLLKSKTPRLVFRKTNRYIISQYIESFEARDKVLLNVNSKELLEYGWPGQMKGSLKSIPAAYLTGFLTGKKIITKKLKTPIFDFGMIRVINKSKVFAFIKGVENAGLEIKCDKKNFPEEERIYGKALKKQILDFEKIKSNINKS